MLLHLVFTCNSSLHSEFIWVRVQGKVLVRLLPKELVLCQIMPALPVWVGHF